MLSYTSVSSQEFYFALKSKRVVEEHSQRTVNSSYPGHGDQYWFCYGMGWA